VRGDLAVWGNGKWGHVAVVAEVFAGGIRIVEQNSSVEGTRVLEGDPWKGYWSDWGTTPACYVHADDAGDPVAPPSPTPASPPKSRAQCDALGYDGACYGETSVWSQDGACLVRDCASEGRTCGWIADGVGWGCLGGTSGATTFDCGDVGYTGVCAVDDTLVWVESGACRVVACPERGQKCGWDAAVGYDCM
jgi:hypothetical protein